MISTWVAARCLACFCTINLMRDDIMTHGERPAAEEYFLSLSIERLAKNMYQHVKENPGSYVFSPYGLSHAITVLLKGAVGETKSEIIKAILKGYEHVDAGCAHELLALINSRRNQSLQVLMTTVFAIHSNVNVLSLYQKDITNFKAHSYVFDLTAKSSVDVINDHVKVGTKGYIRMFLNPNEELRPPSVLVNAIVFAISWERFDNAIRHELPFRSIGGPEKYVRMITLNGTFQFKKLNFASILQLPYGDDYYMYIVLPEAPEMLTKVEDEVFKSFDELVYTMEDKYLQVTIPKFRVDTFHNLNQAVKALGVRKAFMREGSGLSMITGDKGFYLGDIFQRAVFDFGRPCNIPCGKPNILEKCQVFLVDQPFFFVIRTKKRDLNLFRGRVESID